MILTAYIIELALAKVKIRIIFNINFQNFMCLCAKNCSSHDI